jgi:hypothetical protein
MLVGDVRLAMNVLGTPGTKEVIAQLPIDDSLQSKDNVFRPLLNVAKRREFGLVGRSFRERSYRL